MVGGEMLVKYALDGKAVNSNIADYTNILFWRVDLFKRSFTTLNSCKIGILAADDFRFFKDKIYREKILYEDDRLSIEKTISQIEHRIPISTIFRICNGNAVHWFKLSGWPEPDHQYYRGTVEEITEHIATLKLMLVPSSPQQINTGMDELPVALFSMEGHLLKETNMPFQNCFNLSSKAPINISLADFSINESKISFLIDALTKKKQLDEELILTSPNGGSAILAQCRLEYAHDGDEKFLRLTILEFSPKKTYNATSVATQRRLKALCADLQNCQSVEAMLESIYLNRDIFPGTQTIFFSDIYVKQNKVVVYPKGKLNEPLLSGSQFPYAGTIAENIEKEGLQYLIVDDTQSSIKAIDWMVFVPQGLYSYIAKALYFRGTMRTVLILSAPEKGVYRIDQVDDFTLLATHFHRQLNYLRRNKMKKI